MSEWDQFPAAPAASPPAAAAPSDNWDAFPVASPAASAPPSVAADVAKSAGIGAVEGGINLATIPGTLTNAARSASGFLLDQTLGRIENRIQHGHWGATTISGQHAARQNTENSFTPEKVQGAIETVTGPFYQPQTREGEIARTAGRNVPFALAGPGGVAAKVAMVAVPTATEEGAAQIARQTLPSLEGPARAVGAVVGGLGTLGAVQRGQAAAAQRSVIREAPTRASLEEAGHRAYREADALGVQIAQPAMERIAGEISDALKAKGAIRGEGNMPKLMAAGDEMFNLSRTAPTLGELGVLRQTIGDAAGSADKAERRLGMVMQRRLDDALGNLRGADVVSGDAQRASQLLGEARANWAAAQRGKTIEDAITKARRRAESSNSGQNVDNTLRQSFRSLAESERKMRGFDAGERAAVEAVVSGSRTQNAGRLAGNLLAPTNPVNMIGLLEAARATGIPGAAAAAGAAGYVSKAMANRATQRNADFAKALVLARPAETNGSVRSLVANMPEIGARRQALLRALLGQHAASAISAPTVNPARQ